MVGSVDAKIKDAGGRENREWQVGCQMQSRMIVIGVPVIREAVSRMEAGSLIA
jgi:hypothetical protein